MATIIYGLVTDFDSLPWPYVLEGCCKQVPAPTARCEQCGYEVFGAEEP